VDGAGRGKRYREMPVPSYIAALKIAGQAVERFLYDQLAVYHLASRRCFVDNAGTSDKEPGRGKDVPNLCDLLSGGE
jgi:hypothetical protein